MKAAATILAAQLHRNPHMLPTADYSDLRYERGSRPVRPDRPRRRRRA